MKLYYDLHLHSCLFPTRPYGPGGGPFDFTSSGGVNPPCGEVFASAKTLGAPCGALRAIGTMPFCYPEKEFYMKYYYDLHLHSCLSPCGSEDMTPVNLAAMCALAGLDIVALTDHNTCGNCAAFCRAAEERGLLALAGMELCTREEIHVVCLFPTPYHGEEFEAYVSRRLPPLSNHPAVFGHQIYMDAGDLVLGEDPRFLAGHTDIGLEEVSRLAAAFGGAAFPAHIDRPSFSLLGVLGLWMPELGFPLAEVSRQCPPEFRLRPDLAGLRLITNSDAHYLDQVWEAEHAMELPERTAAAVLYWLQGTR